MRADVLAAGNSTVLGIFLAAVLVAGFLAVAALWYFMIYRPSKQEPPDPPANGPP